MPKQLLTDISVRAIKSERRLIDYWGAKTPAFGIRVGPRTKTFIAKVGNSRVSAGLTATSTRTVLIKAAATSSSQ